MSVLITVSKEYSSETLFPLQRSVFNFVCSVVGKGAKLQGNQEIAELCEWAIQDGNLLLIDASPENKVLFCDLLREALNNGEIIRELLSWPTPDMDASPLLPENRTPEIMSFIYIHSTVSVLRDLTIYLDQYRVPAM